ncbi:unnamed protein product [Amaranthus hypochondriacus]
MGNTPQNDLFSSLITDIKSYSGNDPLLPWIRGVRKMRETLPPNILEEKLPRFLQKCAQTFESDRRYRNDNRYIRIWLQLMDYMDEPKALLKNMESKKIGLKRSVFYQAYALFYEKTKKFEAADRMYRLGVQNLAEPLDDLQKAYEQFIQRMQRHKNKKIQCQKAKAAKRSQSVCNTAIQSCNFTEDKEIVKGTSDASLLREASLKKDFENPRNVLTECPEILIPQNEGNKGDESKLYRDDSVVAKFVDSAIVGRSEAEDACHHGLVEPTINMKEAMNAINSMFREPIEPTNAVRKSNRGHPKVDQKASNKLEVFIDEDSDDTIKGKGHFQAPQNKEHIPCEPLKIFVDDELSNDMEPNEAQISANSSPSSSSSTDAFVFLRPQDNQSESSNETKADKTSRKTRTGFREDTVVCRFVGSAILDEPEVENICHHGLVDPTVNLKEAMEDINGMFGKPIDFVRTTRKKRQENAAASGKNDFSGFAILPDDEFNTLEGPQPSQNTSSKENHDLYEPTVFTKEAMDDINNLFSMPLDF